MAEYIVHFRSPMPPHGIDLVVPASGVTYGLMLMRPQLATFRLSRADFNLPTYRDFLAVGAMVTIERTDGYVPYVGFVTKYRAARNDPEVEFTCTDHTWLLRQARTKRTGSYNGAAGTLIKEAFAEMDGRQEPPLPIDLGRVAAGAPIDYEYRMSKGDDFLKTVADMTDYEWGFTSAITRTNVTTSHFFGERRGIDLRPQVVWEEDKHLADVVYAQDAEGYIAASVVVGGDGPFSGRPAVTVNTRGQGSDGIAAQPAAETTQTPPKSPALLGTRILTEPQVATREALFAAARRLRDAPDNVAESLSFSVVESEIDMDKLEVGNLYSVRLADTDLGSALERSVRLLAIRINADSGVHGVEAQIVA